MDLYTIGILEKYPKNIDKLNVSFEKITGILDLKEFTDIIELDCSYTGISELINMPKSLQILKCCYTRVEKVY